MKMTILIIVSILLSSTCCEKLVDHVYSIKIQNSANDTILFYESYDYPDTSMALEKPILTMVYPSDYSYLDNNKKWNEVLVSPKDTISIFLLSKDIVNIYSWVEIRDEYKVLKRYDLSLDDLEQSNFTITYP